MVKNISLFYHSDLKRNEVKFWIPETKPTQGEQVFSKHSKKYCAWNFAGWGIESISLAQPVLPKPGCWDLKLYSISHQATVLFLLSKPTLCIATFLICFKPTILNPDFKLKQIVSPSHAYKRFRFYEVNLGIFQIEYHRLKMQLCSWPLLSQ